DSLNGGGGVNTVSYAGSLAGVAVDLTVPGAQVSGGDANGDVIANFKNVTGSDFNDTLTGDANNNILAGGAGNDSLTGGDGNDTLDLAGNLTTADKVDGGDGNDTLLLSGAAYKGGFTFGANVTGIENIVLAAANDYKLTLGAATNNGGLVVDASALVAN